METIEIKNKKFILNKEIFFYYFFNKMLEKYYKIENRYEFDEEEFFYIEDFIDDYNFLFENKFYQDIDSFLVEAHKIYCSDNEFMEGIKKNNISIESVNLTNLQDNLYDVVDNFFDFFKNRKEGN